MHPCEIRTNLLGAIAQLGFFYSPTATALAAAELELPEQNQTSSTLRLRPKTGLQFPAVLCLRVTGMLARPVRQRAVICFCLEEER